MEVVSTYETWVNFYQTTRSNIPKDMHLQDSVAIWISMFLGPAGTFRYRRLVVLSERIYVCATKSSYNHHISSTFTITEGIYLGTRYFILVGKNLVWIHIYIPHNNGYTIIKLTISLFQLHVKCKNTDSGTWPEIESSNESARQQLEPSWNFSSKYLPSSFFNATFEQEGRKFYAKVFASSLLWFNCNMLKTL
jgi:hypothetical protein